jgi:putative FmdB family regulatory protein
MPTYEYHCSKCDGTFEIVQSIAAKALTTCPKELCCKKKWGKGKVKRAIGSGAGLIFKGSGFYITDYRSENYKQGASKDKGSGGSGGEAKPAASSTPTGSSASSGSSPSSSAGSSSASSAPAKKKGKE